MFRKCNDNVLPYRNFMLRNKEYKFNKNKKYKNISDFKPKGLWYQINNCGNIWGEINWGKHIYKVDVDTSNFCKINNYNDLLKFTKKYRLKRRFEYTSDISLNSSKNNINKVSMNNTKYIEHIRKPKKNKKYMTFVYILWKKVAKQYSGFEVNNFEDIMNHISKLKEKNGEEFDIMTPNDDFHWFYRLDFSSGCVWDLSKVKNVEYFGEYNYKNNDNYSARKSFSNLKKTKKKKQQNQKKKRKIKTIKTKNGKKEKTGKTKNGKKEKISKNYLKII